MQLLAGEQGGAAHSLPRREERLGLGRQCPFPLTVTPRAAQGSGPDGGEGPRTQMGRALWGGPWPLRIGGPSLPA